MGINAFEETQAPLGDGRGALALFNEEEEVLVAPPDEHRHSDVFQCCGDRRVQLLKACKRTGEDRGRFLPT
jgi:hypothetical protein